jgi:hypothetical protein
MMQTADRPAPTRATSEPTESVNDFLDLVYTGFTGSRPDAF